MKSLRQLLVVKARGLPEVTEESLFREVFGNLLARELGVGTPAPALVHLSHDFVTAANALPHFNLSLKPGVGAGCEYFSRGFTNIVPGAFLTNEELAQAALIYGFDLIAQNPDRTLRKPNCALRAGRLMAYDFELAFSFLLLFGQQPAAWEVSKHGIAEKHLFRAALKDHTVDWKPLLDALRRLSKARLATLVEALPQDWRTAANRVCTHVLEVRRNAKRLEFELQRSLS